MKPLLAASLLSLNLCGVLSWMPLWPEAVAQAQVNDSLPIAVLGLSAKGSVSETEASILTDRIRSLVVQTRRFRVMERDSMDKILRDQGFQETQNCQSNDCSIEIGRLLSVKEIITGSISRLGNMYSLNLRMIDAEHGNILEEEFIDCSCSLEILLTEKVAPLVERLLGGRASANAGDMPVAESTEPQQITRGSVRELKPWLLSAEGGYPNYAGLGLQYNFGPYFAARIGSSLASAYPSDNSTFVMGFYPRFNLNGGLKVYFNPDDWAGYSEVYASTHSFLAARVGMEYRNLSGLTLFLAGGWGWAPAGNSADLLLGAGYAF
ncbi:MAG: CsgG/HfaB family protein [Candidatus Sericytochromatia bacterium]